jgi:acetyl/propionyl-CoA carboxylase alpha subunit
MTSREFRWNLDGREYAVHIDQSADGGFIHFADSAVPFRVIDIHKYGGRLEMDGRTFIFYIHRGRNIHSVWVNGHTYRLTRKITPGLSEGTPPAGSGEVRARMPGRILRIEAAEGNAVMEGRPVVIMESMKMESTLIAPRSGRVAAIHCQAGQIVDTGQLLLTIEEAS